MARLDSEKVIQPSVQLHFRISLSIY